jgi:hypothetical protein
MCPKNWSHEARGGIAFLLDVCSNKRTVLVQIYKAFKYFKPKNCH